MLCLPGHFVTPGFVNTHAHFILSLVRGVAADLGFARVAHGDWRHSAAIGQATLQVQPDGTALNAQKRARGEDEVSAPAFLKLVREASKRLRMDFDMLKRPLNVGFSGGEKKRMEILQMALLEPSLLILDETDSGLDIDALRIVSEGVNALRSPERAMLVITHYQRLLDYIKPDRVHVLAAGRIVASGGPELALQLEAEGYDKYLPAAA